MESGLSRIRVGLNCRHEDTIEVRSTHLQTIGIRELSPLARTTRVANAIRPIRPDNLKHWLTEFPQARLKSLRKVRAPWTSTRRRVETMHSGGAYCLHRYLL